MRFFYFGLAAVWGFTAGAAALAIAVALAGQTVRMSPALVGVGLGGLLASLIGAAISAAAYRQARRRGS